MILALLLIPLLAGAAAFAIRGDSLRRGFWLAAAAAHAALTVACWRHAPPPVLGGWLGLDAAGLLVLGAASALFLAATVYGIGFLAREEESRLRLGARRRNESEPVFTGCLLLFLAAMTLTAAARNFGLLWVAVEATTLASAPLVFFHRHARSLEAVWKYLVVCSVGIALALGGNIFLAASAAGGGSPLGFDDLARMGPRLNATWLRAALVFLFVGYGTKMGLAPMHTWLPDAHSESPSMVSALLSGALLNCAFLALWRASRVASAAGQGELAGTLFLVLGAVSLGIAAVFVLGQSDYKRLLAYSSVEHMGILATGAGLGAAGAYGAFFHAVNHSLVKGMLFLSAGNILAAYGTKSVERVRGLARTLPWTGALWAAGLFAVTGAPPFGTFVSEWTILRAAAAGGRWGVLVFFLAALAVIFLGMSRAFLSMLQGPKGGAEKAREPVSAWMPPLVLGAAALALGFGAPGFLDRILREAAGLP